jgi:hypothetical protein
VAAAAAPGCAGARNLNLIIAWFPLTILPVPRFARQQDFILAARSVRFVTQGWYKVA